MNVKYCIEKRAIVKLYSIFAQFGFSNICWLDANRTFLRQSLLVRPSLN